MQTILVIEDEQSIADTVVHAVEREGFAARWCDRGLEALECIREGGYALVVLDVGLPDISGFDLCREIRGHSSIPVIFLTARDDEVDTIVGLELGADDYMTKPFSPRELGARVKSVLRRSGGASGLAAAASPPGMVSGAAFAGGATAASAGAYGVTPTQVAAASGTPSSGASVTGPLVIDEEKLQVLYFGVRLELTRYEFRLLAELARRPGKVFSREGLMERVWDDDAMSLDRTVDAHVKSLRAKCRAVRPDIDPVRTHRGSGYALRERWDDADA